MDCNQHILSPFRYMRMSPERFEHLLSMVAPFIKKEGCRSRAPIPPAERLCICLRYLATGELQQSQSFSFRVGRATVSHIVKEVCVGIWESLRETFLKAPEEIQDWLRISREFENEWNFPIVLGQWTENMFAWSALKVLGLPTSVIRSSTAWY